MTPEGEEISELTAALLEEEWRRRGRRPVREGAAEESQAAGREAQGAGPQAASPAPEAVSPAPEAVSAGPQAASPGPQAVSPGPQPLGPAAQGQPLVSQEASPSALGRRLARLTSARVPAVWAGATCLALAAGLGVFAALWAGQRHAQAERRAVAAVAARFARSMTTFDHRTLDADLARIRRDATPRFREELLRVLGGEVRVFREALQAAEARSQGTVYGVTVTSVRNGRAEAEAYVDQTIQNKDTPEPRIVFRKMRLVLIKVGGRWRVDRVDPGGPAPAAAG